MSAAPLNRLAAGAQLIVLAPGTSFPNYPLTGANAIFVDREGTGLGKADAAKQITTAQDSGLFAILRVDCLSSDEIEMSLGLELDALILHQINNAFELEMLVALVRGQDVSMIAQVETVEAMEIIADLMTVPGIAGFLIDPFDLARAIGSSGPDAPEIQQAVGRVAETLLKAGLYGLPTLNPTDHKRWRAQGAQLLYVTPTVFKSKEFAPCLQTAKRRITCNFLS